MRKFDYSFLKQMPFPAYILNQISELSSLHRLADIRKQAHMPVFEELVDLAKLFSVESSNAIEGIVTTEDRLKAIVQQGSRAQTHAESEIAGYRDALAEVYAHFTQITFDETSILRLHAMIMEKGGGVYKAENNLILAVDGKGERHVRFRPISAADTPKAMEQLCLAYMDAKDDADIHPLLLIPCVILDFLCIHPFADGNGRLSRLLSLLLLYQKGYDVGKYASFEWQIRRHRNDYYEALRRSSEGWCEQANDYIPFMQFFLAMLFDCYIDLGKRFEKLGSKKRSKKDRIEDAVLHSLIPISKAELCADHPDISPTTVEAVLAELLRAGKIQKLYAARATRYTRGDIRWSEEK